MSDIPSIACLLKNLFILADFIESLYLLYLLVICIKTAYIY